MNKLAAWKLVSYMIVLFAAGAVTGAATSHWRDKRVETRPRTPRQYLGGSYSDLKLTDDQKKKIDAIVEEKGATLGKEQADYMKRIRQIRDDCNKRITNELTPEQRQAFELKREQEHHDGDHRNDHKRPAPGILNTNGQAPGTNSQAFWDHKARTSPPLAPAASCEPAKRS